MILLWGVREDAPLAFVEDALAARGTPTTFVDQRVALAARLTFEAVGPVLRQRGAILPLGDATGVYPRPYPLLPGKLTVPGLPAHEVAVRHVQRLEQALWQWMAVTTATVLNRPGPAATNCTKPYQTEVARACGFDVPATVLTNDAERALAFACRHKRVVYKAAGGARTYAALFDPADRERLERLRTCPTLFQEYVEGTNVRVHVVATSVFAVAIRYDGLDYRRGTSEMTVTTVPEPVAKQCVLVCQVLGLQLAGIDLIHTADDRWYFLEANTSPAFTFYPDRGAVGGEIVRLLTEGDPGRP